MAEFVEKSPVPFNKVLWDMVGWLNCVLGWSAAIPFDDITNVGRRVGMAYDVIDCTFFSRR